jgi:hypothetical protein
MACESKVEFSGTKKRERGGNCPPKSSAENHNGPYARGKHVQVPSSPSAEKD